MANFSLECIHCNQNIHSINVKIYLWRFYPNFHYCNLKHYTDILCAAAMIVRKTKASEKTAALMLKTIVSILVYQNLKIIYI